MSFVWPAFSVNPDWLRFDRTYCNKNFLTALDIKMTIFDRKNTLLLDDLIETPKRNYFILFDSSSFNQKFGKQKLLRASLVKTWAEQDQVNILLPPPPPR